MILLSPPMPSAARMVPSQLADAARDHHHERVDDVVLAEPGPHVADLGERAAGEAGQPAPEREGGGVHPAGADAEAGAIPRFWVTARMRRPAFDLEESEVHRPHADGRPAR